MVEWLSLGIAGLALFLSWRSFQLHQELARVRSAVFSAKAVVRPTIHLIPSPTRRSTEHNELVVIVTNVGLHEATNVIIDAEPPLSDLLFPDFIPEHWAASQAVEVATYPLHTSFPQNAPYEYRISWDDGRRTWRRQRERHTFVFHLSPLLSEG